jgi:hypothetical protein
MYNTFFINKASDNVRFVHFLFEIGKMEKTTAQEAILKSVRGAEIRFDLHDILLQNTGRTDGQTNGQHVLVRHTMKYYATLLNFEYA